MNGFLARNNAGIGLPPEQFATAFPFHFAVDRNLSVIQAGATLARICEDVEAGRSLPQLFRAVQPLGEITLDWLLANRSRFFLLEHIVSHLQLRGGFMSFPGEEILVFLGSPWFTDAAEIAQRGLGFEDFAVHDPVVDMLHVYQANKVALLDAKKLAAKLTVQRSALQEINERLRRQEAEARKLALIAARTDNAVILTDEAGITLWVNEGFTRLTGYEVDEIIGRKPGTLLQGEGTCRETVKQMGMKISRGEGFKVEVLNYRKDLRSYWVAIEVQPIFDHEGNLTNFMAIESDITDRRASLQRSAIQSTVSRILAEAIDTREAASKLLHSVCENLGWQVGQIWQVAGERLKLIQSSPSVSAQIAEFIDVSRSLTFSKGVGLPGLAWSCERPVWIADVTQADNFPRAAAAARVGLRGAFAFPVIVHGKTWGIVEFFSARIEEPDEPLLAAFGVLGSQIGQFIVRRQAEEALRATNTLHQAILAGANYSIISTAPDGMIRAFNAAAERMLGYDSSEVLGKVTPAIIHDPTEICSRARELSLQLGREIKPGFEAFVAKAALGEPDEREWTYIRKDGTRFPVLLSVTALFDEDQTVVGYLGIALDITDQKQAAAELVAAKQAAEAASVAKTEFLATISHELRTPLTSIRGFIQTVLEEDSMPAESRMEFLEIAYNQSLRLSQLVGDLLDLTSLESGKKTFHEEHLNLPDLARVCLNEVTHLAVRRNQTVKSKIPSDFPAFVGDMNRIHSVFTNLLSNAVKFTPEGGNIGFELSATPTEIIVVVKDDGLGIPEEQRNTIFEKFYRVHTPGRSIAGTGLGLAIVKAIVDHYRGRILVESAEGQGSLFRIHLPIT